jgi:hypothetical protein
MLNRIPNGNNGSVIVNLPCSSFGAGMILRLPLLEARLITGMIRAEVHILDAGHFAMDLKAAEIIELTRAFMKEQGLEREK